MEHILTFNLPQNHSLSLFDYPEYGVPTYCPCHPDIQEVDYHPDPNHHSHHHHHHHHLEVNPSTYLETTKQIIEIVIQIGPYNEHCLISTQHNKIKVTMIHNVQNMSNYFKFNNYARFN